jgi:uncharacterized membrane protein
MSDQSPDQASPPRPAKGLGFVDVLSGFVVAGLLAGTALIWFEAPEGRYPIHMGLSGQVDRWADKTGFAESLLLLTGICALIAVIMAWCERNPMLARQVERAGPVFTVARVVAVLAPAFAVGVMAAVGLGVLRSGDTETMLRVIMGFVALVILAVGEPMGKAKPNALAGVRTYFTLTSRQAWDKSNRLAGRLFFWIGAAGVVAAIFAPQPQALAVFVGALLVSIVWTLIEGWRVWRTDPERREAI